MPAFSIPISALQHYLFCPRQCALIHVEQEWSENYLTAAGKVDHQRVDSGESGNQGGIRVERSVHLQSARYGIHGVADLVEYHGASKRWSAIVPVEYKHGKPKEHRADEVQLCAQALCLEEIHGIDIPLGAFFYWRTRRRHEIAMDDSLRELTCATILAVQQLIESFQIPEPSHGEHCSACSMNEFCLPGIAGNRKASAIRYIEDQLKTMLDEETGETS